MWIELPWPENLANTYTQHTETLDDSCFDLIRSHQQCISWSPLLKIKPATIECRAETLPLNHQSTFHTSDAKLTSHGNCAANKPECVLQVTTVLFTEKQTLLGPRLPERIGNTHPHNYYNLKGKDIGVHFLFKIEELYCELNYHAEVETYHPVLQLSRVTLSWSIQNISSSFKP